MIEWRGIALPALARACWYHGLIDGDRGMRTIEALLDFAADPDMGGTGREISADALATGIGSA